MMASCVFLLLLPLTGQQSTTTYTRDVNGRNVPLAEQSSTKENGQSVTTEYTTSVNGRKVPLESTEERVLREDSTGRTVERVIKRYDPNGNPGPVERQKIEVRLNPDGSSTSVTSVYRGDLNGRMELAERVTAEGTKSGNTVTTNTQVERPALNGSVEIAERQVRRVTSGENSSQSEATTYRKDPTGAFVESLRVVTDSSQQNGQTVENRAQYERLQGERLQLQSQTVTRARKNSDGTEVREVDIFRHVPGRAESTATPRLTERQIVEQRREDGRVVERKTAQRPTINDPDRLGAAELIGERVCTGKCI